MVESLSTLLQHGCGSEQHARSYILELKALLETPPLRNAMAWSKRDVCELNILAIPHHRMFMTRKLTCVVGLDM